MYTIDTDIHNTYACTHYTLTDNGKQTSTTHTDAHAQIRTDRYTETHVDAHTHTYITTHTYTHAYTLIHPHRCTRLIHSRTCTPTYTSPASDIQKEAALIISYTARHNNIYIYICLTSTQTQSQTHSRYDVQLCTDKHIHTVGTMYSCVQTSIYTQ
eukprot:GHVQ01007891.1.p1 GENE.GHVQ01007891.1~~GHVQ01007891.1.p1  ORF type:complete len:156 (-),score=28.62 GHVQ01007891.1:13-480(-)